MLGALAGEAGQDGGGWAGCVLLFLFFTFGPLVCVVVALGTETYGFVPLLASQTKGLECDFCKRQLVLAS